MPASILAPSQALVQEFAPVQNKGILHPRTRALIINISNLAQTMNTRFDVIFSLTKSDKIKTIIYNDINMSIRVAKTIGKLVLVPDHVSDKDLVRICIEKIKRIAQECINAVQASAHNYPFTGEELTIEQCVDVVANLGILFKGTVNLLCSLLIKVGDKPDFGHGRQKQGNNYATLFKTIEKLYELLDGEFEKFPGELKQKAYNLYQQQVDANDCLTIGLPAPKATQPSTEKSLYRVVAQFEQEIKDIVYDVTTTKRLHIQPGGCLCSWVLIVLDGGTK
ncbi:hypothetical protein H4219_005907 [Mycoemilia scoparia]|uniref:Uncharacterized protein n=1 Tax=Mycoemilia scoparia TaxID=417184 RepID=A0A9W7ZKU9_9FUNG|nr:hypothetical protein H4219_005907 [Mycoemilia scoparia]